MCGHPHLEPRGCVLVKCTAPHGAAPCGASNREHPGPRGPGLWLVVASADCCWPCRAAVHTRTRADLLNQQVTFLGSQRLLPRPGTVTRELREPAHQRCALAGGSAGMEPLLGTASRTCAATAPVPRRVAGACWVVSGIKRGACNCSRQRDAPPLPTLGVCVSRQRAPPGAGSRTGELVKNFTGDREAGGNSPGGLRPGLWVPEAARSCSAAGGRREALLAARLPRPPPRAGAETLPASKHVGWHASPGSPRHRCAWFPAPDATQAESPRRCMQP